MKTDAIDLCPNVAPAMMDSLGKRAFRRPSDDNAVAAPAAGIVRDAIEDFETDVRMIERDAAKLGEIARADPDREAPLVHGFGRNVSNPQIDDL